MRTFRSIAAVAAVAVLLGGCTVGATNQTNQAVAGRSFGTQNVALYDDSVVHDIAVTFDQTSYDTMIATYASSQDKEWIEATVTIDGITMEKVGMRLKGNSSLRALGGRGGGPGGAAGGAAATGAGAGAGQPQSLPWLIRLDKYVDGQSYQGQTEIVIRGNTSRTSLNEAVALELIALGGEATQDAFPTRFSVNGGAKVLRLAIENPNDEWEEETFDTDGILYKAESTGDYSYRGDDPKSYDEIFDQESDPEKENLAPLIDFLKFINTSTDAVFASDLAKHLDVNAFARYLALQDLVSNWDDIDGPGNNSYLRYDEQTKKFTVLSWDMNLAFGGAPGGNLGGPGGAGAGFAGGAVPPAGGMVPPAGGAVPPAGQPGARAGGAGAGAVAGGAGAGAGGARMGGPGGRTNILVQRFQANASFAGLVTQAKADLTATLYTSGKAAEVLTRWTDVLKAQATDLVDVATIDREAAAIRQLMR